MDERYIELKAPKAPGGVIVVDGADPTGRWRDKWIPLYVSNDPEDDRTFELRLEDGRALSPAATWAEALSEGQGTIDPVVILLVESPPAFGPEGRKGARVEVASPVTTPAPSRGSRRPRHAAPAGRVLSPAAEDRMEQAFEEARGFLPPHLKGREFRSAVRWATKNWAKDEEEDPLDFSVAPKLSRAEWRRRARTELSYDYKLASLIGGGESRTCGVVAVISPKGGVGKTLCSGLIGSVLAQHRNERVLEVDANPDYGTMGLALAPNASFFVDDMARLLFHERPQWADVTSQIARAGSVADGALGNLFVLPAPPTGERLGGLSVESYRMVIRTMPQFFNFIVLDCGTGMFSPIATLALEVADQIVVVTDSQPSSARVVAQACKDVLSLTDKPLTLVVNRWRQGQPAINLRRLMHHVDTGTPVALTLLEEERKAATSLAAGRFSWVDAPTTWQQSVREIACVLVGRWRQMGVIAG